MGEEPEPTPASENVDLVLSVDVDGKEIELVCPDYGGEQLNDITELTEVSRNWIKLINNSDRWILFIRSQEITPEYDLSISSYEEIETRKSGEAIKPGLSYQSRFIELLQYLLYVKNKGVKYKIKVPSLCVVLTCWDELATKKKPKMVLKEKTPMLLHFVEALWSKESLAILGLSAQEFPLNTEEASNKYQDELPENFGYIVNQKGERDNDITKLVKISLGM